VELCYRESGELALLMDEEETSMGENILFSETLEGKICTVRKPAGGGWLVAERAGSNLQQKELHALFQTGELSSELLSVDEYEQLVHLLHGIFY